MAYVISRFQYGVTLNPREFILNTNNTLKKFGSYEKAKQFLLKAGYYEKDIDNSIYIDDEKEIDCL